MALLHTPEHLIISRQVRHLVWLVVALYLIQAGLGTYFYITAHNQRNKIAVVAIQSAKGLCAVRHDAEKSIQRTSEFLKDHPHGIPGISAKLLKRGRAQQQTLVDNLSVVVCPPTKPIPSVGGRSAK